MANAKEITLEEHHIKVLVYGKSGTGKTTFAGTFPAPYILDFDDGILSLAGDDVEYETFTRDDPKEWERFNKHLKEEVIPLLKSGERKTLILDSLTTLGECAMSAILKKAGRFGQNPQLQDWLTQVNLISTTVNQLLGFPCNIVLLAHEQYDKDENTGSFVGGPMITGKYSEKVVIYFDEVYRSVVRGGNAQKEGEYVLQTKSGQGFLAKSRVDNLLKKKGKAGIPPYLDPSYPELLKLVV